MIDYKLIQIQSEASTKLPKPHNASSINDA